MANRVVAPNLFATTPPNWSLQLLDANATNATGAINDSSLGSTNGPLPDNGTVNNYAVTCAYGVPSALNNGMTIFFIPANTNTGASTLTVSPLASAAIVNADGTAVGAGALVAGTAVGVVYDGTSFRIFNAQTPPSQFAPQIYAARMRSYNALNNPGFEIDQRNVGASISNAASGTWLADRWEMWKTGSMAVTVQRQSGTVVPVPGTLFGITSAALLIQISTRQASLGSGDYFYFYQVVEGSQLRELVNDVHSVSLLVYSSVAPLKFGVFIRCGSTYSVTNLATISTPNTWTLIQIPNIPVFPGAAGASLLPGNQGYNIGVCLAAGSSVTSPSNGVWNAGNYLGATGQDNFFSNAINSQFLVAFVQHEPGPQATTFMDKPWNVNYQECLRYYAKSWDYATAVGTVGNSIASVFTYSLSSAAPLKLYGGVDFPVVMAKSPTIVTYNDLTGSLGGAQLICPSFTGNIIITSSTQSTAGISTITSSASSGTAPLLATCNWTADTSW